MPKMLAKIEGRGNGIKTVILNMADISKALNVHPDCMHCFYCTLPDIGGSFISMFNFADPTKYFGLELGSQSKFDKKSDRAVINGAHDTKQLSELLNKFIESFILCPNCRYTDDIFKYIIILAYKLRNNIFYQFAGNCVDC